MKEYTNAKEYRKHYNLLPNANLTIQNINIIVFYPVQQLHVQNEKPKSAYKTFDKGISTFCNFNV